MATPRTINPDSTSPRKIGGEDTNPDGLAAIQQFIAGTGDSILHHTTFDFGIKVLALTYQGLILAEAGGEGDPGVPSIACASYSELHMVDDTGHDREIRLVFQDRDEITYRMGDADAVSRLKSLIRSYRRQFLGNGDPQLWSSIQDEADDGSAPSDDGGGDDERIGIGERVRFWQEQDQLNQALVPRVIAQGELLSQHIAEHDDLSRVVSGAVQFALLQQSQRFADEVVRLSAEYTDQLRAATDEAICKIRHENEEMVSGVVADNGRLEKGLRRTRIWLSIAVGVSIAFGVVAVVIAVI